MAHNDEENVAYSTDIWACKDPKCNNVHIALKRADGSYIGFAVLSDGIIEHITDCQEQLRQCGPGRKAGN